MDDGYLEEAHFSHNPTVLMARTAMGQLIGFQSFNKYRLKTPFSRRPISFLYGGLAFQHTTQAQRRVGFKLTMRYLRHALGPLWFMRQYAFMTRTATPRVMQILSLQHQLFTHQGGTLTPNIVAFALNVARTVRRIPDRYTIDKRLVLSSPPESTHEADITDQWQTLYQAKNEYFNQLAFDCNLIVQRNGRYYLTQSYLLLIGYHSPKRLWSHWRKR